MYVVAIDASKDDLEGTDYKAFENCKDAKDRFFRAWVMIRRQKPVFEARRPVHLYAARLYEVEASEPRTAIRAGAARRGETHPGHRGPGPRHRFRGASPGSLGGLIQVTIRGVAAAR